MKKIQLCLIGLLLTLVLIGCSSDAENEAESEGSDSVAEEENNADNESSDSDTSDTENEEDSTNDHGKVLSLGETGAIEINVGNYEVTVNSFEIIEEFDGTTPLLKYFVLVDYTVTNIGDEPIVGEDIYRTEIIDDQGFVEENHYFESINQLEGEIAPGESVDAELLFDSEESEHYQLVFNYASATTVTWEFSSDEASN